MNTPNHALRAFREAKTYWHAACVLLEMWQKHAPAVPARASSGPRLQAWRTLEHRVHNRLVDGAAGYTSPSAFDHDPGDMPRGQRTAIASAIERAWSILGFDALHAAAWGIDTATYETFPRVWAADHRNRGVAEVRLDDGAPFPVLDADSRLLRRDGLTLTSRPAALTAPDPNELPHVRVRSPRAVDVVIDLRFAVALNAIADDLRVLTAGHPNVSVDGELELHESEPGVYFPIGPQVIETQGDAVARIVDDAFTLSALEGLDQPTGSGSSIVVLPELSVSPSLIDELQERVDDAEATHLLVAGSMHVEEGGARRNISLGLLAASEPLIHRKLRPIVDELGRGRPWSEGIDVDGRPELRIFHADRMRLAILICKDFLDRTVVAAAVDAGATCFCVPSMSEKTGGFKARVMQTVSDAQALSVVAVGPLVWAGSTTSIDEASLFGQPLVGRELVTSPPDVGIVPSLTAFTIGEAHADDQAC